MTPSTKIASLVNPTNGAVILCILYVGRFIFWKVGVQTTTQLGMQSVLGALYASTIFLGIINALVLQPVAAENRGTMYRERAAGMYDT